MSAEIERKLEQVEQEIRYALMDFPEKIAVDRLKFALSLVAFVRLQLQPGPKDTGATTVVDVAAANVASLPKE